MSRETKLLNRLLPKGKQLARQIVLAEVLGRPVSLRPTRMPGAPQPPPEPPKRTDPEAE